MEAVGFGLTLRKEGLCERMSRLVELEDNYIVLGEVLSHWIVVLPFTLRNEIYFIPKSW